MTLVNPSKPTSSYRPDIDGLRAVAILAVIFFHAGIPGLTGGFVGVDIFFVISGYLIGAHVYSETRLGVFKLRSFYERRAKRILPAFLFVLAVCDILCSFTLSAAELRRYGAEALAAMLSSSNIYFWLKANYFAPHAEANTLLMTWSLGVEEQFYFGFPLLMLLLRRLRPRQVLTVLGFLAFISFSYAAFCVNRYPGAAFYLLPSRAWELAVGCILGIHDAERRNQPATARLQARTDLVAAAGFSAILAACTLYTAGTPFPGMAALLPTCGALALIASPTSWVNRRLLSNPPMAFIGRISYSWYLWHWPLLSLSYIYTGGLLSPTARMLVVLVALLLSVISYSLIEQPFRRTRRQGKALLAYYALACAVFAVPAWLFFHSQGWPARYPVSTETERLARQNFDDTCLLPYGATQPIRTAMCMPPIQPGHDAIALMGDSHASALAYELRRKSAAHAQDLYEFTKMSCAPLGVITRRVAGHPLHARECAAYNQAALAAVLADSHIHTVILAGYWSAPFPLKEGFGYGKYGESGTAGAGESWAAFRQGLGDIASELARQHKSVWIVLDVPRFKVDPLSLTVGRTIPLRRWLGARLTGNAEHFGYEPESTAMTDEDRRASQIVREVAAETHAHVLDLPACLCTNGSCAYAQEGKSLYVDEQHLSFLGASTALARSSFF